jgi:hypothetical protein
MRTSTTSPLACSSPLSATPRRDQQPSPGLVFAGCLRAVLSCDPGAESSIGESRVRVQRRDGVVGRMTRQVEVIGSTDGLEEWRARGLIAYEEVGRARE